VVSWVLILELMCSSDNDSIAMAVTADQMQGDNSKVKLQAQHTRFLTGQRLGCRRYAQS